MVIAGDNASPHPVYPQSLPADLDFAKLQIKRLRKMEPGPEDQKKTLHRQVYLLTCWQERDRSLGTVTWRYRLEAPGYNQYYLFRTLNEVLVKIEDELDTGE